MFSYLWLLFKRFAVLIPGIVVAYFSTLTLVPYFHHRLPLAAAVFVTYVLVAYLIIPFVWRALRIFFPAQHLPLYCVTPDGYASDPLNIGLVGSRKQLIAAMEAAGWHQALPTTPKTIVTMVAAIVFKRTYHGTPMSNLYLFGRKQDIGFELQLADEGRGHRHHVRFWATTLHDIQEAETAKVKGRSRKEQEIAERLLWAGAASRDIGVTLAKGTFQLTHAVSPNTNGERSLIVNQLEERELGKTVSIIRLYKPYRLPNFAWSRSLRSDGKMAILRLR